MKRSQVRLKFRCADCGKQLRTDKKVPEGSIRRCQKCRYANYHKQSGTRLFWAWQAMKLRCFSPTNKDYKNYGARGITVCERWMDFRQFAEDMGPRPKGMLLDRIENNGNYEPSNCRWATPKQSGGNTRKNCWLTFRGETLHASEWARRTGLAPGCICYRLKHGWTAEQILTTRPTPGAKAPRSNGEVRLLVSGKSVDHDASDSAVALD